jgi:hypothetical protein
VGADKRQGGIGREEGRKGLMELWGMRKAQKERRMELIVEE